MALAKNNIQTEEFITLTPSVGNVGWRLTDQPMVKVSASSNLSVTMTNLTNGANGMMRVAISTNNTSITINVGAGITVYQAGRFYNLPAGVYVFCVVCEGTNLFCNIMQYSTI